MGADFENLAAGDQGCCRVIDFVHQHHEEAKRLDQRGVPKGQRQPRAKEVVAKLPEDLGDVADAGGT